MNNTKRTITEVLNIETGEHLESDYFFSLSEEKIFRGRRKQEEYIQEGRRLLVCPYCYQPVKIRGKINGLVSMHFAHLKDSDDCPIKTGNQYTQEEIRRMKYNGAKESDEHKDLKNFIAEYLSYDLRFSNVEIEKTFYEQGINEIKKWRRPDISCLFQQKKIVFEIQLSTTFLDVIVARELFYKRNQTFIIWVFNGFSIESEKQVFTQKDILYSNKQNVFILDKEARIKSEKEQKLFLKCFYRVPYIGDDLILDYKNNIEIISFDDLKFDNKEYKLYYYDLDLHREQFRLQIQKRLEQERLRKLEEERLKQERLRKLEEERLKQERLRKLEEERLEQERLEQERLRKLEEERLEQERLRKLEEERLEQERLRKLEEERLKQERELFFKAEYLEHKEENLLQELKQESISEKLQILEKYLINKKELKEKPPQLNFVKEYFKKWDNILDQAKKELKQYYLKQLEKEHKQIKNLFLKIIASYKNTNNVILKETPLFRIITQCDNTENIRLSKNLVIVSTVFSCYVNSVSKIDRQIRNNENSYNLKNTFPQIYISYIQQCIIPQRTNLFLTNVIENLLESYPQYIFFTFLIFIVYICEQSIDNFSNYPEILILFNDCFDSFELENLKDVNSFAHLYPNLSSVIEFYYSYKKIAFHWAS